MQFHAKEAYECMFKYRRHLATLCHKDLYMRWRESLDTRRNVLTYVYCQNTLMYWIF